MNTPNEKRISHPTGLEEERDLTSTWLTPARQVDPDAAHELLLEVLSGRRPAPRSAQDAVRRVRAMVRSRERTRRHREALRARLAEATIHATVAPPHGWVELRELIDELRKVLGPVDVEIFCMLAQGFRAAHIALVVGLSPVAIRQRISRIRRRLAPLRPLWTGGRA